jgi:tetratricopeptide (TPR) repeat protein
LARLALANSHLDEARQHIDRALWVRRQRTSTLVLAARIYRLSGAHSEAEAYLARCGQLHGMSEPVQLEWMLLRAQLGEVDELAPRLLALVGQVHPEAPAILETLASVYILQARYWEAFRCLQSWLELEPDSVRALDWRGWLHHQLDRREEAIHDYQRILELRPAQMDIRLRLAKLLVENKREEEAAPHLERLLRETPDDPDVAVALAPCRVAQSRVEEARALLKGVLEQHPDHFDALLRCGRLELSLGNAEEAERYLREAVRLKPHDIDAHFSLYQSLQGQPHREKETRHELAQWELENKRLKRLNHLLRQELAAHPEDADLACEAGELFLQLDEERGLFWLYRALAIKPRHIPSRRALLAYYERTHNDAKAEEQRKELARLGARPSVSASGTTSHAGPGPTGRASE